MKKALPITGKKVLVLGNWSYKNMGDELILLGTIRLLQEQGNEVIVSAYDSERLKTFFAQFKDLKPITFLHEFPKGVRSAFSYFFSPCVKELKKYRDVDVLIIGGGEILTEESVNAYRYWNVGLLPLLGKLWSKKNSDGVPVYLMGGIQIPTKKKNLIFFNRLLKHTKQIFARDEESVAALQKFGYPNAEFFMDTSYFSYPWETVISDMSATKKTVLVNLNKNGEQFFDDLVKDCEMLLATGFQIKYVPVSKGKSPVYNDLFYKQKLEQHLGVKLEVLDWESDFSVFVQELANAEMVITARLHLFLISSFLGVKVKVFPYQKKILKMQKVIEKL